MTALESITLGSLRSFTREDVKFIFAVGDSTIDEWQSSGMPHFKKGRVVRYPAAELVEWRRKLTVNRCAGSAGPRPEELERFWEQIERMVSVVVRQVLNELQHPNHLEAA